MEAQIRRILIKSAEGKGWDARRDQRSLQECPYSEVHLRLAWKAGWEKANGVLF